jgi:4'-phosphopantetheinyl transferase
VILRARAAASPGGYRGVMADSRTAPRVADLPPWPGPDECHVWTVTGPELDATHEHLLSLLDSAERARAERYRHRSAYRLFVASRAAQRVLAGEYLGREPTDVVIDRHCPHCGDDGHGRPRLAGVDGGLDFSVAHTERLLLIAYVSRGLVGVDVEAADREVGENRLVDFTLTPAEAALVSAAPQTARAAAFHRLWTRKEAVLKLTGHGLAVPLRSVDVSADIGPVALPGAPAGWPGRPIRLTDLRLRGEPTGADTAVPGETATGTPRQAAAVRSGAAGDVREYVVAVATTDAARRMIVRSAAPQLARPTH